MSLFFWFLVRITALSIWTGAEALACDPAWLPVSRIRGETFFVATTSGSGSPVPATILMAEGMDGVPSGAALLVPWSYAPDCSPSPWSGSAWDPPDSAAFYTGALRPRSDWIADTPTVDVAMAEVQPIWQTADPRWLSVRPGDRLLTPKEFFTVFAVLPFREEMLEQPDSVAATVTRWIKENPELAARPPASAMLSNLLRHVGRRGAGR
jgi:hypothetical protein